MPKAITAPITAEPDPAPITNRQFKPPKLLNKCGAAEPKVRAPTMIPINRPKTVLDFSNNKSHLDGAG